MCRNEHMRDRSDFIARRISKMLRAAPGTEFRAFGRFQGQPSHRTARLGNVGPMTTAGKYRIMIYGPKDDGTYVVEFRTDEHVQELPISHRISDTTASSARRSARVFCSKTSRLMLSIVSQARW